MASYPKRPPRATAESSPYFLTFCTLFRRRLLHEPGVPEFLIQELYFYSHHLEAFVAYTIMPDHLHLIVEIDTIADLSRFLRDFKKYTSVKLKQQFRLHGSSWKQRIWQPGTMDHCIRMHNTSHDYENHLNYLFHNSVKHLGIAPLDFPYHNFIEFVKPGLLGKNCSSISEETVRQFALYES